MKSTLGQFYFKRTINGNLLGEFSNTGSTIPSVECADLEHKNENHINWAFAGEYHSTWPEDGRAKFCILEITPKQLLTNMYRLEWSSNHKVIFVGEGFVVDGMLIGHYRSPDINID